MIYFTRLVSAENACSDCDRMADGKIFCTMNCGPVVRSSEATQKTPAKRKGGRS